MKTYQKCFYCNTGTTNPNGVCDTCTPFNASLWLILGALCLIVVIILIFGIR